MEEIYRTTIHGQILESRNLRQLLARAVFEKREMDRRLKVLSGFRPSVISGQSLVPAATPAVRSLE